MPSTRKPRPAKGTPTATNLYVLGKVFAGVDRRPNRVEATESSHLQRCVNAGLVRVDGSELVLTDAGKTSIGR